MAVLVTGLPPQIDVTFQICGDAGLLGSAGCNLAISETTSDNQFGQAHAEVALARPPVGCPCVLQAISPELARAVQAPVTIFGVPSAPIRRVRVAERYLKLRIVQAALVGDGPWQSWFGGAPHRSLVLTLVNGSRTRLFLPPLILTLTPQGAAPMSIGTPQLPAMAGHSSRTLRLAVTFPSFSTGSFAMKGYVVGARATTFRIRTSMYPLGLFGVLALLLGTLLFIVALGVRGVMRRRRLTRQLQEAMRVSLPLPGAAGADLAMPAPAAVSAGSAEPANGAAMPVGAVAEAPATVGAPVAARSAQPARSAPPPGNRGGSSQDSAPI